MSIFRKYAYAWITLGFFLVSLVLHWWFGWQAFQDEAREHGSMPEFGEFVTQATRDTFENWQSEFLQLLWQVVGLAYFLYVGSPSSKENDDRMEAKLDALIRISAGTQGDALIHQLDYEYARDHGHAQPHRHSEEVAQNAGKGVRHVCQQESG
jgi:hypothetical protein